MAQNQRPEDEDTKEHDGAQSEPPATGSPAPPSSSPANSTPPNWTSQSEAQAQAPVPPSWQPPTQDLHQQPGQAWQQPPAQPGQPWQQPPPAWQQPPPQWTPQQGWGQAGYWTPAAEYANNPLVIIAGVVLLIFGLLVTLVGIVGLLGGMMAAALFEEFVTPDMGFDFDVRSLATVVLVIFGIVLVLGILHLLSALGIFLHKGWARAIGLFLAVLGTLIGVLMVVTALDLRRAEEGGLVVALVVAVGYGLTLFALILGGNHFRRKYHG